MLDNTDAPQPQQDEKGRFLPGNSGFGGRPKGSRNKLGEAFIADMLADWQDNGKQAIIDVREQKPDAYLKVVASILPKELNIRVSEFDDLTDDQLARQLAAIATQLASAGISLGEGVGQADAPEPSSALQTLQ